jgi:hypothetical protein
MKKVSRTLAVLAALTLSASATDYRIVGGAVSDDSGAPIVGATVELMVTDVQGGQMRRASQTTTDELGRYSFSSVNATSIFLFASKAGIASSRLTQTTKSDKDGVLVMDLTIHRSVILLFWGNTRVKENN